MHIRVLGSGAGGGFPQWNCNCPNCSGVRAGLIRATPRTQSSIADPGTLSRGQLARGPDRPVRLRHPRGGGADLYRRAPEERGTPYSPHRHNTVPGDNIGVRVRDERTHGTLFYAPGLGRVDDEVLAYMQEADCLLVDGTLWSDDELIRSGIGDKPGSAMGHLDQSGRGGIMEHLGRLTRPRKILIHINNTNPILDEDSPERHALEAAGIEVAYDGMTIEL